MSLDSANETKKCKHCQSDIPKKAKVCPNCRKKQGGIAKWIIIAVVVLLLFSCASGGSDNEEKASNSNPQAVGKIETNNNESNVTQEIDNEFAVGDIVETSDLKISFVSAKEYKSDNEFAQPENGNIIYKMEFEFENISNSDRFVSSFDFSCYADSYSAEEYIFGDDILSATLSSGKKTKGYVYYEIPEDAEEIILEYETNFWTEDKVIFKVK